MENDMEQPGFFPEEDPLIEDQMPDGSLTISIREGLLGDIRFTGNDRTRESIIRRDKSFP